MENSLFDQLKMLEQVPTDLMTEVTEPKTEGLLSAADHTEIKIEDSFNAGNTPGQSFNTGTTQPGQPQPQSQRINAANLITGTMAVNFLDMLLPVICVLLIEKINGKKTSKKYFQATPDEKKILEPVLHNYLMSINFNIDNPLNALLITVAFIYGTKTVEVLNDLPQQAAPVKMPSPFNTASNKAETRGRHKLGCNCEKCRNKRK